MSNQNYSQALRDIHSTLRNIKGSNCPYNKYDHALIEDGSTITFEKDSFHALGYSLGTGASLLISIDGGTAIEYTSEVEFSFTQLNEQSFSFEASGGDVVMAWIKK